ncbi:hypothetical protein FW778_04115 [Ginsengibacter hankyongi]|uniref:Uncharacterized protein n=1 Tax=Ginsengibacter hankyongi TaxID=2607284 RepID=A0A5J5IKZ4_9BACT|nr:hypothetical protein [Ginsengibacter hankyongi]KAA9041228.1 hypothetical protein FW778_04115 [Ginsengibacter hankyongi]
MLKTFKEAGEQNSRNHSYQFWIQDNQPKIIYTEAFVGQKPEYIHTTCNAGIVEKAEEYIIGVPEIIIRANHADLLRLNFCL